MQNKFYTICDSDVYCIGVFSSKEKALQGFRECLHYRKSTVISVDSDGYIWVNNGMSDFVLQEFELDKI